MDKKNNLQTQKAYAGFTKIETPTFGRLIKQVILRSFDEIKLMAEKNQVCKRKAVGCTILEIELEQQLIIHYSAINGPSGPNNKCSGEKGNCGCSHSEPRAIIKFLKQSRRNLLRGKTIILTTYSECNNCANIIVDSGIIDVAAYDIYATHWPKGVEILKNSMPVWTKQQIEEDVENNLIKDWLLNV